ncbi:MAG: TetR/AcrR family transcriptional regulator [bacterium]
MEIAAEEFSLKGFDGASFNRIIERAGLSKGAAYYYFDDKADLFDTVIQFGLDQFTAFIDATSDVDADPEEFWETTRAHVRTGLQLLRKQSWIVGFIRMLYSMHGSAPNSPVVKKAFDFGRLKTRSSSRRATPRCCAHRPSPPNS